MSKLEHPRPEGLLHNPAFSQVVTASGGRTIYIVGQVSIDEHGARRCWGPCCADNAGTAKCRSSSRPSGCELLGRREDHDVRRKLQTRTPGDHRQSAVSFLC